MNGYGCIGSMCVPANACQTHADCGDGFCYNGPQSNSYSHPFCMALEQCPERASCVQGYSCPLCVWGQSQCALLSDYQQFCQP